MWRKRPGDGEGRGESRWVRRWRNPESRSQPQSLRPAAPARGGRGDPGRRPGCALPAATVPSLPLHKQLPLRSFPKFSLILPLCGSLLSQFCSPFEADGCPCQNSRANICVLVCKQSLTVPRPLPWFTPSDPEFPTPRRFPDRQGPRLLFESLHPVIHTGLLPSPPPPLPPPDTHI